MVISEMKYYWIGSTIEIKTGVLPCREFSTKILILSYFRSFLLIFKPLYWSFLLIFFKYFISHFYNIFRSSKSWPCSLLIRISSHAVEFNLFSLTFNLVELPCKWMLQYNFCHRASHKINDYAEEAHTVEMKLRLTSHEKIP